MSFSNQLDKLAEALRLKSADVGRLLGVSDSTVRGYRHRNGEASPEQLKDLVALAREHGVVVDLEYFYWSDADPLSYSPTVVREERARYTTTAGRDVSIGLVVNALAQNLRALGKSVEKGLATAAEAEARLSHAAAVCAAAVPAVDGEVRTALEEADGLLRA